MLPDSTASAPVKPTPAYTIELTNRVAGFVIDEKKVARSEQVSRRLLISSNSPTDVSSCPYALTTFALPIISSMYAVSSPRVFDCSVNIACVRCAMNFATNSESGVITTTTAAMPACLANMNPSVPRIVITPVNSCVKPIRRPSAHASASEITRLTISPCGCESI